MTGSLGKAAIVILDPVGHIAAIQIALLKAFGLTRITLVRDPDLVIELMRDSAPDLLIINWSTMREDWTRLMAAVRDEIQSPDPFIHVMLATPSPSHRRIKTAICLGVDTVISVPLRADTFYGHLRRIVETPRMFVRTSSYFGPNRRRRNSTVVVQERRNPDAGRGTFVAAEEVDNWRRTQREIARSRADLIAS